MTVGTRWGVLVFFLEWEPTFRMLNENPVESPAFSHRTGGGGWVGSGFGGMLRIFENP